ncbi:MAG: 23S rRNA (cytosine1962-C5)-methyltransferase [Bradymonadia bacterium]|jgi:23S rRNA (cytosine1962-C5)-methyltransferase
MEQYERLSRDSPEHVVEEFGLKFMVNLDDYLDTGLFLDHRMLRREVGELARDKNVLNLFAYTGSFTVHAAAGGARGTTTVDLSQTYLDWAVRNLNANDLGGPQHERFRDDTFQFVRDAIAAGRKWDLVIVDPPTFSNSKRMRGTFDVQRDHAGLLGRIVELVTPGGQMWFSTNRRKFAFDGANISPECTVTETTDQTIPADFSQKRPHRSYRIDVPA